MKNIALVSAILIIALSFKSFSFSGNGSGTPADPYQITNVEQLQEMEDILDAHYVIMNDIDASDTENWNNGNGFDPIGTQNFPFMGTLDGNGYTIDGLYINRPDEDFVGLFGYILNSTEIINLNIYNVYIIGNKYIGALSGFFEFRNSLSSCLIDNCSITGDVISDSDYYHSYIGGIIGMIFGNSPNFNISFSINNCNVDADIESNKNTIGGLAGMIRIFGKFYCSECKSAGRVESNGSIIGGLVGKVCVSNNSNSYIQLSDCLSTCDISGNAVAGGFAGFFESFHGSISVLNCSCYGIVTFTFMDAGGFTGVINEASGSVNIENCFCTGTIDNNSLSNDPGGFIGACFGTPSISCCFWQENSADHDIDYYDGSYDYDHSEIYKKTQEEMQRKATFASCFDFVDNWIMGGNVMPRDNFYPIQRSLVPAGSIIPTLTEWAAILFGALLLISGGWYIYFKRS